MLGSGGVEAPIAAIAGSSSPTELKLQLSSPESLVFDVLVRAGECGLSQTELEVRDLVVPINLRCLSRTGTAGPRSFCCVTWSDFTWVRMHRIRVQSFTIYRRFRLI